MAHQNIWVKCWNSETPLRSSPVTLLATRMGWLSLDKLESLWAKKRNGCSTWNVWNTTYALTPLMGRIGDVRCSCQPSTAVQFALSCEAWRQVLLWTGGRSEVSLQPQTFSYCTAIPVSHALQKTTRPWRRFCRNFVHSHRTATLEIPWMICCGIDWYAA